MLIFGQGTFRSEVMSGGEHECMRGIQMLQEIWADAKAMSIARRVSHGDTEEIISTEHGGIVM